MLLAADDSHTGRVLRNHELEQLGLGTLRVLMDVLWFERSPVKLSEATVGKGGRKADDCVDVPPGHLKLDSSEDGKEDLESAVKLNSWLDSHCKSPQSMKSSANGSSGLDIGSLTLADHQRKLEHVATEASDKIVTSSSSTLKGGNLQYNFHGGVPVSIKPPGYARERLLRHTIASRLTGLPYVSHPLIVQVLIESDANLPD